MADPREVRRIVHTVMEQLAGANPAVIVSLVAPLTELAAEQELPEMEYINDPDVWMFECPHCFAQLTHSDIELLQVDVRQTPSADADGEPENETGAPGMLYFSPDTDREGDYQNLGLVCGTCDLPSRLPPGWNVEMS